MTTMQGQLLSLEPGEADFLYRISQQPGAYGKGPAGDWFCTTPNGLFGCLAHHSVVEHDDGTVTVSPSILVSGGGDGHSWHGYLERGIWREC